MRTLTGISDARVACVAALSLVAILAGCTSSSDSVTVDGNVPIAYVKRSTAAIGNPTEATTFSAGGDLYIREMSSPSATETNVTGALTQGHGDVSDPEVSYDGTKLLFAMRCVTGASNSCLNPDGSGVDTDWRIWEFDIAGKTFTRIRCDAGPGTPPGDDVDPAYLPDGRIVFVSNRQLSSRQHMTEEGQTPFAYLDEYERQRTTALHVMNADGTSCRQISFNQSHDRNPTVLQTGEIMYSRWDHVGTRNQFTVFSSNPDGTSLFVLYGAHSGVNSFLHPREMPNGQILSDAMPLSRTHEGGALMAIDVQNYSENGEPGPGVPGGGQGQHQVTAHDITVGSGISPDGRFTTPYPLWDGTNRALVVWTPSCLATQGPGKPNGDCVMQTDAVSGQQVLDDRATMPTYGVYMLDLGTKAMRPVVTATPGFAVLDPVAIQPRPLPNVISDKALDATLAAKTSPLTNTTGVGILSVRSVYDTDGQGRMGDPVLVTGESIPKLNGVADIARLKDPAQTTADRRPARFIRVTRAVPTQSGISRAAIGETDFEMQQILGYVPIEPDGSFKIEVPAEIPLGLTVIDSAGRGFQTHTSWIQVRPGETRTCNGCHSPRRGNSINVPPIAGNHVNSMLVAAAGESMAETRARLFPAATQLSSNMSFTDVWTDTTAAAVIAAAGVTRPSPVAVDPGLRIDYTGLTTAAPVNGVIDYATHIAPLWTKARTFPGGGDGTCTTCHNGTTNATGGRHALDLQATPGGTGRVASYDSLMIGDPVLNASGQPILRSDGDEIRIERMDPQVEPGLARGSHLIEVLFNQELKAGYPLGPTNHSGLLNASELRLVSEWIDLGAQYYNSPRDSVAQKLRGVQCLNQNMFNNPPSQGAQSIHDRLISRCSSCHEPVGLVGGPTTAGFTARRYVLTGDPEGDYNVTLSMISDTSTPANNELLRRPLSNNVSPSPAHGLTLTGGAIFADTNDPDYVAIANWITSPPGVCQ